MDFQIPGAPGGPNFRDLNRRRGISFEEKLTSFLFNWYRVPTILRREALQFSTAETGATFCTLSSFYHVCPMFPMYFGIAKLHNIAKTCKLSSLFCSFATRSFVDEYEALCESAPEDTVGTGLAGLVFYWPNLPGSCGMVIHGLSPNTSSPGVRLVHIADNGSTHVVETVSSLLRCIDDANPDGKRTLWRE